MNNKKILRILSSSIVFCMLLFQFGCASKTVKVKIDPMEPEESYAVSYDIIGGKDVMPIGGFFGPYQIAYAPDAQPIPDFCTDEFMKEVAESGVNLITFTANDTSGSLGRKLLDLGAKYGVGYYVHDTSILDMRKEENISTSVISEKLSAYRNHPAFCGLYVVDEPGGRTYHTGTGLGDDMEHYEELTSILKEELEVDFYTNLIQVHNSGEAKAYEGYLEEYCETMHPTFMSFDCYVSEDTSLIPRYLYNLSFHREYAQKYKLPLWTFIGCGSKFGVLHTEEDENGPMEGLFDWNVNVSLAFGVQGLNYFTVLQPHYHAEAEGGFDTSGMFGARGNKNRWYYYVQDLTKQITAIDAVLMNSVNKGIIVSGEQAISDTMGTRDILLEGKSWRELSDVNGNTIIGCFNYQGKTALYVVNHDYEYAQDITLSFYDRYNMQVTQDGETKYLNTSSLTLSMKAGDGVLIVLQ